MPESILTDRIKRLDNRLANQIAAGEVVERPASVVKELLENSIDAGATRIEVDIERGGTRLIRLTDNGNGIVKDDLKLALSRHATSKITSSKDLSAIVSLGFRGEALASIASVSRLCLTSRTQDSDFAWQAVAEGRDMSVDIQPASAATGTRIEVRDLFYNTPARQKFLRAEKTEFNHVEEIFKRHALVNFDTSFILKHNHKIVKRVPASRGIMDLKRVESICGKAFAAHAIEFSCDHEALSINGWVGGIDFHRSESDIQYVFVNGRPVKDRMLNHAIRQSYQGLLPAGRMPTYVIFLQIDHDKIDVNVHPTKHEVRFDEQRLVHDLLVKSVTDALLQDAKSQSLDLHNLDLQQPDLQDLKKQPAILAEQTNVGDSGYSPTKQPNYFSQATNQSANRLSSQIKDNISAYLNESQAQNNNQSSETKYLGASPVNKGINFVRFASTTILLIRDNKAVLVQELDLFNTFLNQLNDVDKRSDEQNKDMLENAPLMNKPLLFPITISLPHELLENSATVKTLNYFGFYFEPEKNDTVILRVIPVWWHQENISELNMIFPQWVAEIDCLILQESEKNWNMLYQSIAPLTDEIIGYFINQLNSDDSLFSQAITDEMIKELLG